MGYLRVWNLMRTCKKLVKVTSGEPVNDFLQKCADKLEVPCCENMRLVIEEDGTEVDEPDMIIDLAESRIVCILLGPDDVWIPAKELSKLNRLMNNETEEALTTPQQSSVLTGDDSHDNSCIVVKMEAVTDATFGDMDSHLSADGGSRLPPQPMNVADRDAYMEWERWDAAAAAIQVDLDEIRASQNLIRNSAPCTSFVPVPEPLVLLQDAKLEATTSNSNLPSLFPASPPSLPTSSPSSLRNPVKLQKRPPRPFNTAIVLPPNLKSIPPRCGSCEGCGEHRRQLQTRGKLRGCLEANDNLICSFCSRTKPQPHLCVLIECDVQRIFRRMYKNAHRRRTAH